MPPQRCAAVVLCRPASSSPSLRKFSADAIKATFLLKSDSLIEGLTVLETGVLTDYIATLKISLTFSALTEHLAILETSLKSGAFTNSILVLKTSLKSRALSDHVAASPTASLPH